MITDYRMFSMGLCIYFINKYIIKKVYKKVYEKLNLIFVAVFLEVLCVLGISFVGICIINCSINIKYVIISILLTLVVEIFNLIEYKIEKNK